MQNFMNDKSKTIFASLWANLLEATTERNHPWRNIQLSTVSNEQAFSRTVVLRTINKDRRSIECHTDLRSPKVMHIENNSRILWLAYDSESKIQIRCFATAKVKHKNSLANSRWATLHSNSQLTYANKHAPSSQLSSYNELKKNTLLKTEFNANRAFENFAVIESQVHTIDYLSLKEKAHVRLKFKYENEQWRSQFLAP